MAGLYLIKLIFDVAQYWITELKFQISGEHHVISVNFPTGYVRVQFRWVADRYAA
jgi:hypothetical protein